ncbi:hypothetical protein Ahy_B07g086339 [Arachis hypogaea]|uniref:Uncharacterized protein n=1 Tax=Arachis hypogaea TaxID=3818 RepID=A0A444Y9H8_ARAHY|nr:hypothetical protein Ahy_B07g086339 [Arachis hypogaea]
MRSGIMFTDKDPLCIFFKPSTSFTEFQNTIIQKLGLQDMKRMEKVILLNFDFRFDIRFVHHRQREDLQVLFHYRWQFLEPSTTVACSSSRPVGASSSLPVIESEAALIASWSKPLI